MILHPVLHTLPEQQQIELLTHYANNIIGEGRQIPNKVFKSIRVSQNALIFHKLEDHMLSSDKVIDCYLDIIEKGIQHCVNHKEAAMDSMPSLGMPLYEGWYEKDLATIAACPRISHEHIKRIRCLLGHLVDLVPIEATSAAMYGDCFSALSVNPKVDANALKLQLEILVNRIQQQHAYFRGLNNDCFLAAHVLRRVVGNIFSKRNDDAEIISLLEQIGRQGKSYLTSFAKPVLAVSNVFDLMESAGDRIKMAYKSNDKVTSEQLVKAMKMFNFHPCNKKIETSIENNLSIGTDNAINDFQYLLQLFNATAIRLKQFDAANGSGGLIDADREIMCRSGRLLINLMESGSISEGHIQSAAQAMLETKSGTKDADTGLEQYSLVGMVDWIKKRGFLDSKFIIDTVNDGKINVDHYRLLEENPSISISEMDSIIVEVYLKVVGYVNSISGIYSGRCHSSTLEDIPDVNVLTKCRQFLFATLPMLLTAKYYPALLADEPMDVNGVARAFEMGIYFSLFDEVDIKLMARAGMNDIYKAIKPDIMEKIEKNAATHELVTGLLLQERLEQAENSPILVNRKRPSF